MSLDVFLSRNLLLQGHNRGEYLCISLLRQTFIYLDLGVHIGHAAVAGFYIGPVKKFMELVMRRKMLI